MSNLQSDGPPKLLIGFLHWFCDAELLEDVEGDLTELFDQRSKENLARAKWLMLLDVLQLIRPGIVKNFFNYSLDNSGMYRNYFKVAMRNAWKFKSYTALNLLGLVVGITSSMLILLWVDSEFQIDKFHDDSERIFKIWRNMYQSQGEIVTTRSIPQPLQDVLNQDYPEIDEVALQGWEVESLLGWKEETSIETGHYVSPNYFNVFDFPLIIGDKQTVLADQSSIVISDVLAEKYFGEDWRYDENIIGQVFRLDDRIEVLVSGVFKRPGNNSSIQFDWLASAQGFIAANSWVTDWGNGSFEMYIKLKNKEQQQFVATKMVSEINDHTNGSVDEKLFLQSFGDRYLYSKIEQGAVVGGRIDYVQIMFVISIFLLVLACINFINLVTARSNKRSKEVGLRKVMGAKKGAISVQFFIESYLLTAVAMLLALLLVALILPLFEELMNKDLMLNLSELKTWVFITGVFLSIGFLSGIYPAILLPKFKIGNALKGTVKHPKGASFFRKGLVVFQFGISILLIIGTIIVYQQINFVLEKDLGLDKDNVLMITMEGELQGNFKLYKSELLKIPGVQGVTAATGNPLNYSRSSGSAVWEGKNPNDIAEINVLNVCEDFVKTLGVEIIKGGDFDKAIKSDTANYLINQVAANLMGFKDPVGKKLSVWNLKGKILGVVKDFHMNDLYNPVAPLIIRYDSRASFITMIKTTGDIQKILKEVDALNNRLNPAFPFRYEFMDETYTAAYENEQMVSRLVGVFSFVSILISCLGLFGLSAFSANQRAKEIGVRKVHGASVWQIIGLLSKEYTLLISFAFIIAVPLAWIVLQDWLESFEFRIEIQPLTFLIAGLIALIIGSLTVGFKSFQAAVANPIDSLKDE